MQDAAHVKLLTQLLAMIAAQAPTPLIASGKGLISDAPQVVCISRALKGQKKGEDKRQACPAYTTLSEDGHLSYPLIILVLTRSQSPPSFITNRIQFQSHSNIMALG